MARTIELILKIITEPARKQLEEMKRKIANLSQLSLFDSRRERKGIQEAIKQIGRIEKELGEAAKKAKVLEADHRDREINGAVRGFWGNNGNVSKVRFSGVSAGVCAAECASYTAGFSDGYGVIPVGDLQVVTGGAEGMPRQSKIRQQLRQIVRRMAARGEVLERGRLQQQIAQQLNRMTQQAREEFAQELEDLWAYVYGGTLRRAFRLENLLLIARYGEKIRSFYRDLSEQRNGELARQIAEMIADGEPAEAIAKVMQRRWGLPYYQLKATVTGIARASSRANVVLTAISYGAKAFRYAGPRDSWNRPFCANRVGKVFTLGALSSMENDYGQRAWLFGGGWNCRHHWEPVMEKVEAFTTVEMNETEKTQPSQFTVVPQQVRWQYVQKAYARSNGDVEITTTSGGKVLLKKKYLQEKGEKLAKGQLVEVAKSFNEITYGLIFAQQQGLAIAYGAGENLRGGDVDATVRIGNKSFDVEIKTTVVYKRIGKEIENALKRPQSQWMIVFYAGDEIELLRAEMEAWRALLRQKQFPLVVDLYWVWQNKIQYIGRLE